MASFNLVVLVGNMVADPELRVTPGGINVCSFRIAVGRPASQGDKSQVDFIEIVSWRKTAEFTVKYFRKGDPILVRGALQTQNYTDKNNQKHYKTVVNAEEVNFVGRKAEGNTVPPSFGRSDAAEASALDGLEDLT